MPLTIQQLAPHVGSIFTAQTQAGPFPLTLADAAERPRGGLPPSFATPLSLLFQGPLNVRLQQDNFQLEHPELGAHIWMLVPVLGPEGEQGYYEVILSQKNA